MFSYLQAFVFVNILLFLGGMVFWLCRKALTPLRFYILGGVFLGCAFLGVLLPWTIPDGAVHFWVAYQRAAVILDGDATLARKCDVDGYQLSVCENPTIEVYEKNIAVWSMEKDETLEGEAFVDPGLSFYKSWNYWPQILGILIGRKLHLNFLPMVYLARLLELLAVLCMVSYSIYRTPIGKHIFAMVGLLPIGLQIMSGISYDGMVMAVTMNFIASALWCYYKPKDWMAYLHLVICCALLALTKGGGYLILLPLAFLLLSKKTQIPFLRKSGRLLLVLAVGLVTVYFADKVFAPDQVYQFGTDTEAMLSTGYALQHPLSYLQLAWHTYVANWKFYFLTMTGSYIGYLEYINASHLMYLATVLILLAEGCFRVEQYREDPYGRWKIPGLMVLALPVLIALISIPAMLLKDTAVGSDMIAGIQGRYYLPIYPLILIILCYAWPVVRRREWKIKGIPISQLLLFAFGLLDSYFVFHTMQVFLSR